VVGNDLMLMGMRIRGDSVKFTVKTACEGVKFTGEHGASLFTRDAGIEVPNTNA
jgi:hypothetical protein